MTNQTPQQMIEWFRECRPDNASMRKAVCDFIKENTRPTPQMRGAQEWAEQLEQAVQFCTYAATKLGEAPICRKENFTNIVKDILSAERKRTIEECALECEKINVDTNNGMALVSKGYAEKVRQLTEKD